jgi:hypothetical protein
MTSIDKLITMGQALRTSAWLMNFDHGTKWHCHVTGEHDGTKFEIKVEDETADGAVINAWAKWVRLTDRMPEFNKALPPPAAPLSEDEQEGDHFMSPSVDDEIP